MGYVQNESKNCICEKDTVNINFYFSFFKFTFIFYFCFFIIKICKTNIYKKRIESLTNSQGFIELKRIKQKTKRNRRREGRVKKRKKMINKERDKIKGIKRYLEVSPPCTQWSELSLPPEDSCFFLFFLRSICITLNIFYLRVDLF